MDSDPDRWYIERISPRVFQSSGLRRTLFSGRSRFQSIEVLETEGFGRTLVLDGKTQSAELDEFIYHEALVHPALITRSSPKRVFIAGGGEGAVLREVLKHKTVENVVMADLDQEVVELCRDLLPEMHQGSFNDPRVSVSFLDARVALAQSPEPFDVILSDVTDPLEEGPSLSLYTNEFYGMAKAKLTAHGVLCVQAGPALLGDSHIFASITSTLRQVFPLVFPYTANVPSFGSNWGFVLASLQENPLAWSIQEVDKRIARRVGQELRFYDGVTHRGLFALPKYLRQDLSKEHGVITDQTPLFASPS